MLLMRVFSAFGVIAFSLHSYMKSASATGVLLRAKPPPPPPLEPQRDPYSLRPPLRERPCKFFVWNARSALLWCKCSRLQDHTCKHWLIEGKGGHMFLRVLRKNPLFDLYPCTRFSICECLVCGHTLRSHIKATKRATADSPFNRCLESITAKGEETSSKRPGLKRTPLREAVDMFTTHLTNDASGTHSHVHVRWPSTAAQEWIEESSPKSGWKSFVQAQGKAIWDLCGKKGETLYRVSPARRREEKDSVEQEQHATSQKQKTRRKFPRKDSS